MTESQYHSAVERLEHAMTDDSGRLRPFTRIELEPIAGQVRWTIWDGDRRIYMVTGGQEDLPGFLEASGMFMQLRAGLFEEDITNG
jgi:hypothetical protein